MNVLQTVCLTDLTVEWPLRFKKYVPLLQTYLNYWSKFKSENKLKNLLNYYVQFFHLGNENKKLLLEKSLTIEFQRICNFYQITYTLNEMHSYRLRTNRTFLFTFSDFLLNENWSSCCILPTAFPFHTLWINVNFTSA